jgi:nucleoside 2-deoxyribosyltransferase
MTSEAARPLLVGEIFIDFTITAPGAENKLRLGGVTHAARGMWATGTPFDAAVVLPSYLEGVAQAYFSSLGCVSFSVLGTVNGCPNVTAIFDATEVADQGYESLLREEKSVTLTDQPLPFLSGVHALIFPGTFDLNAACELLPADVILHIDVAYDVDSPADVAKLARKVETIFLSTSSSLFMAAEDRTPAGLLKAFEGSQPCALILKENRGGSRLILKEAMEVHSLPAQLGTTVNSVGVGDVFAAVYLAHRSDGAPEAGWRATYASAAYSQTTYPDLFKTYVERDARLSLGEMQELAGVALPWEAREKLNIYLAAPDFQHGDRAAIDRALAALSYHNFKVRRPVLENGELPPGSDHATLLATYRADCDILSQCDLVLAVPTGRDPGTLVEIGLAIGTDIPVVVFDPGRENANTMVIAGSAHYSDDLEACLNSVFSLLSARKKA